MKKEQSSWKIVYPLILGLGLALFSGCGQPRVVLVPSNGIFRAGPNLKGQVYVLTNEGWELSKNKVMIPEGFYIMDVPPEE